MTGYYGRQVYLAARCAPHSPETKTCTRLEFQALRPPNRPLFPRRPSSWGLVAQEAGKFCAFLPASQDGVLSLRSERGTYGGHRRRRTSAALGRGAAGRARMFPIRLHRNTH